MSFWIKTTDTAHYSGYAGTPQVPVFGGDGSAWFHLSFGVDAGRAACRQYWEYNDGGWVVGWQDIAGDVSVADGLGHYLTFVCHAGTDTVDIYVDGAPDVLGVSQNPNRKTYAFSYIGRSQGNHYANMVLDDVRIYDTALSQTEIQKQIMGIPEPSALAVLGLSGLLALRRRR